MKIRAYWHLLLKHHWRQIVAEQLLLAVASGLYDAAESIAITAVGPIEEYAKLTSLIVAFPKVTIRYYSEDEKRCEFPALEALFDEAWLMTEIQPDEPYVVFYWHTKGVTHPNDSARPWRDVINDGLLTQWREHVKAIRNGFDTSGPQFLGENPGHWAHAHYSGNFWSANAAYIARLKNPRELDQSDRWQAEWWLTSASPRVNALPFRTY